jgi:hypothetical protein
VIVYGQTSDVLFFASPFAPEWDSATAGGQYRKSMTLPSPTPEPATLSLLLAGFLLAGRRARKL